MILAMSFMIATVFIPFFAPNIQTLLVGAILQGIPWGVFQTLTTAYASEIVPVPLWVLRCAAAASGTPLTPRARALALMRSRPILTTYVNLCWVMGQLIATGVLRGLLTRTDEWVSLVRAR